MKPELSLQCKALLSLAQARGNSGDKTVEQDLKGAVTTIQQLEQKSREDKELIEKLVDVLNIASKVIPGAIKRPHNIDLSTFDFDSLTSNALQLARSKGYGNK